MFSFSRRRTLPTTRAKSLGFTLIELLVVMATLALLMGVIGPKMMGVFDKQKPKVAAMQIADIEKALEIYKLDVGRFPNTEEGLAALLTKPGTANGWSGPYLKGELPLDPWGKPYRYASPGANGGIDILSLGADGATGGEGENADLRNRQ